MLHRPVESFDSLSEAQQHLEEQGFSWVDERRLHWVAEVTKAFIYINADQTVTVEYV